MNVEQLSEKIAALYFFIFPHFPITYFFLPSIQYSPLSSVFINMNKIEIIELPKIYDPRGCLTVAEESSHIPFEIKKVEWKHIGIIQPDAPIELGENPMMLIALAGEITIQVTDEDLSLEFNKSSMLNTKSIEFTQSEARTFRLTRPNQALILGKDCKSSIIDSTKHSLLLTIH